MDDASTQPAIARAAPEQSPKERPYRISGAHQEDLRRFFREGFLRFGQSSNFGAQIERLSMYGVHARPCRKCGGDPERNIPGTGFVTDGKEFKEYLKAARLFDASVDLQTWLDRHNSTRFERDDDGNLRAVRLVNGEITCGDCSGTGWKSGARRRSRGPITARPTSVTQHYARPPDVVSEVNIAWIGLMSRRIEAVRALSPIAAETLREYFDPAGGSPAVLWHLTPAGRTMLRGNGRKLPQKQFFENLRDEQKMKPTDKRARQFKAADEQARELLDEMHRVWGIVVGDVREVEPT